MQEAAHVADADLAGGNNDCENITRHNAARESPGVMKRKCLITTTEDDSDARPEYSRVTGVNALTRTLQGL